MIFFLLPKEGLNFWPTNPSPLFTWYLHTPSISQTATTSVILYLEYSMYRNCMGFHLFHPSNINWPCTILVTIYHNSHMWHQLKCILCGREICSIGLRCNQQYFKYTSDLKDTFFYIMIQLCSFFSIRKISPHPHFSIPKKKKKCEVCLYFGRFL